MVATMPMIRVREKHQITLPKEIVTFLHLKPDTYLEYSITNNGVMIRAAQLKSKRINIFRYAGAGKRRVYKTAQEADAYIANLRDEWER